MHTGTHIPDDQKTQITVLNNSLYLEQTLQSPAVSS